MLSFLRTEAKLYYIINTANTKVVYKFMSCCLSIVYVPANTAHFVLA